MKYNFLINPEHTQDTLEVILYRERRIIEVLLQAKRQNPKLDYRLRKILDYAEDSIEDLETMVAK